MYDIKGRIKLLIILIDSGKSHRLNDEKIKRWEQELNEILEKYKDREKFKQFIEEVKNGMERIN